MISVAGHPYEQECQPVAEALVDVRVSDPGLQPFARAISGLWYRQAMAVAVHERGSPCGLWTLAISPDLSSAALAAVEEEVKQGVKRFGVTASPVPTDPDNGMEG